MSERYLSLDGYYALDGISYYLCGEKSKPSDIINEKYSNIDCFYKI